MAESDLKTANGPKVVVLVTDGEETCEGDAEKVIQKLRDKGIDVTFNIVGFAIDDAALESKFESKFESWAELGGGRYFSAKNQEGLSEDIEDALRIPFIVYDEGGNEVAAGVVGGDPVELEQGFYRVVVMASPPKTFDKVDVRGESDMVLKLE